MRGSDEDTGEYRGDSRSQQRREALEVLALGEQLVALTDAQLAKLPVPEHLLPHILDTRRITSHIARKRQLAFLAKQMRREDDERWRRSATRSTRRARRRGARRPRCTALKPGATGLLDEGDAALAALLDEHPTADRQHLRQLVRNALEERKRNKPPRAYRELFRELRDAAAAAGMPWTRPATWTTPPSPFRRCAPGLTPACHPPSALRSARMAGRRRPARSARPCRTRPRPRPGRGHGRPCAPSASSPGRCRSGWRP